MEISDDEIFVQRQGGGRRVIRRWVEELVVARFDDGREFKPGDHGENQQDEDGAAKRLHAGRVTSNFPPRSAMGIVPHEYIKNPRTLENARSLRPTRALKTAHARFTGAPG